MKIGEIITNYCNEHGLSYRQFALQCGVTNGYVSMLVNGANPKTGKPLKPTIETYGKLAAGMGISIDDLFQIMDDAPISISILSSVFSTDTPSAQKLRAIGDALSTNMPTSANETELLEIYRSLNDLGQQTLLGTARGLAANPDMKKDGASNTGTA